MSQESVQPAISAELTQKVQALRALATSYNLLDKGHFPHASHAAVALSLEFLRSLHESVKAEALAHPEASLVPELQALKGASNEQA